MILPLGYRLGFGDRRADYPIGDAGAVAFSADLLRFANRRKGSETENVIARDCNLDWGKIRMKMGRRSPSGAAVEGTRSSLQGLRVA